MSASNLHKPRPLLRLNPSHTSIKPAQTSPTLAFKSFPCSHQTCANLINSCVWILLILASKLRKPQPLLSLNPSQTTIKPAQTYLTLASESFLCVHQTCTNLDHSCVWILLMKASNLHKLHPLLRLNHYHACIKPAQTSPALAFESSSWLHQTCANLIHSFANLTHSCVWIRHIQASNLHKHQPLLSLSPSHAWIKPSHTSPTPASESISYKHQTCKNLTQSCVWIFLMSASNLRKSHSHLRLNPSHTSIKPAQTSSTLASESFSYLHQTCANLNHSCVWILLKQVSNLHKPTSLLRLNPSHACIKPAQTSPTPASESFSYKHQTCTNFTHSCVWILPMLAWNLRKPHPLLRLNPSHTCIKPAQTSTIPESESFSNKYQTCTNLPHSCVWILLMLASNLRKPHRILRLNRSHSCIKPAQTSSSPAFESFSYKQQTCTNLAHSCVSILAMLASKLHKPRPLLRLNPSNTSIKPAQTSPTLASESFSCLHQTCANLTESCVWIVLIHASNLHKHHPLLRLNPSHTSNKPAQTSPTLAFQSLPCSHQTCANLTHSCIWILLIQVSKLHKHHSLLRLNPSHTKVKLAQTSTTLASETFSCLHQTCTNLAHSCVWILLIQASNLHELHPLLLLNHYHACIKPAQTSPTSTSESFSYKHQTCTNLTHSCVWFLLIQASNLHKHHPLLRLNPSHLSIKPEQTSPTPASDSFSYKHQTCTNLTHSYVRIFLMLESNLRKPHSLLRLNSSHACIKPAQTSPTPVSESFSCLHQTCTNVTLFCVRILLIHPSNLHKTQPLLRLNPSHINIKPAQTSPTPASESFSYKHQSCTNLTQPCVWILLK